MSQTGNTILTVVVASLISAVIAGGTVWYILDSHILEEKSVTQIDVVVEYDGSDHIPNGATQVFFDGEKFVPELVEIKTGETVMFMNRSQGEMYVHADPSDCRGGVPGFDPVSSVGPGESQSFTFVGSGFFGYHDHDNEDIGGKLYVTN